MYHGITLHMIKADMLCKSRLEFNGKFIDLKARYSGVEYFVHGYKS